VVARKRLASAHGTLANPGRRVENKDEKTNQKKARDKTGQRRPFSKQKGIKPTHRPGLRTRKGRQKGKNHHEEVQGMRSAPLQGGTKTPPSESEEKWKNRTGMEIQTHNGRAEEPLIKQNRRRLELTSYERLGTEDRGASLGQKKKYQRQPESGAQNPDCLHQDLALGHLKKEPEKRGSKSVHERKRLGISSNSSAEKAFAGKVDWARTRNLKRKKMGGGRAPW